MDSEEQGGGARHLMQREVLMQNIEKIKIYKDKLENQLDDHNLEW